MQSIYDDNLFPENEKFREISKKFSKFVKHLLKEADDANLNVREVAHQLTHVLVIEECFLVVGKMAAKHE